MIYQKDKDVQQAFKYLDDANAITPDSLDIIGTKVAILKAEGRKEEALKIIDEYVNTHDSFDAYRMRGIYYANEGNYDLAEKDYRKLTTFEENNTAGFLLLSNFYVEAKQIDKAISAIEEGLVKYPENVSLESALMRLLVINGPTRNIERVWKTMEDNGNEGEC